MFSNRIERYITIIASLLTIGQIIYVLINRLESYQVPFWLFSTTAISCFILGFLIRKRKRNLQPTVQLKKIGQVRFDYLPDSPANHGWNVVLEAEDAKNPKFSIPYEPPVVGALSISHEGRYYMDYLVDQTQGMTDFIEFYCKYSIDAGFYLNIKVTSRDENRSDSIWICYGPVSGETRQAFVKEWKMPIPGELLEGGWIAAKILIAEDVMKTFGKDGWVYRTTQRIRLRGSLSISPITFYKVE